MTDPQPPASRALDALGIPHRIFRHEKPVTSLEQAAAERGQTPGQVARSIVFRLSASEFALVLVAGPAQVSWPGLRAYLGQSRLSLATPEEVLAVTGYRIGTVSPLGLATPLRILVDESVFANEEVSLGSGQRDTGIILSREGLLRAIGTFERGNFSA
jgi:prolyl-tRNA editing enzyme YbaK/EbsC (Cys-tRNA(Pro) deacylase)